MAREVENEWRVVMQISGGGEGIEEVCLLCDKHFLCCAREGAEREREIIIIYKK